LDPLDRRLVELALVVGELVPVGVGALDDDLPLLQQALEEQVDLELLVLRIHHTDGDVLEVDEQGNFAFAHSLAWSAVFSVLILKLWVSRHLSGGQSSRTRRAWRVSGPLARMLKCR